MVQSEDAASRDEREAMTGRYDRWVYLALGVLMVAGAWWSQGRVTG